MSFNKYIRLNDGSVVVLYSNDEEKKTIKYHTKGGNFNPETHTLEECSYDFVFDWMEYDFSELNLHFNIAKPY